MHANPRPIYKKERRRRYLPSKPGGMRQIAAWVSHMRATLRVRGTVTDTSRPCGRERVVAVGSCNPLETAEICPPESVCRFLWRRNCAGGRYRSCFGRRRELTDGHLRAVGESRVGISGFLAAKRGADDGVLEGRGRGCRRLRRRLRRHRRCYRRRWRTGGRRFARVTVGTTTKSIAAIVSG